MRKAFTACHPKVGANILIEPSIVNPQPDEIFGRESGDLDTGRYLWCRPAFCKCEMRRRDHFAPQHEPY
jgi:hypothetical protein